MEKYLHYMIFENSLGAYITCVVIVIILSIAIKVFKFYILRYLERWTQKTVTKFDDFVLEVVKRAFLPLAYAGAFYVGLHSLVLHPAIKRSIEIAGLVLITVFCARALTMLVGFVFKIYLIKQGQDDLLERSLKGILNVIQVVLWALAIIFLLDNLGFKISTVIAGLGIGGVAVALAAQTVLKDLFSYFSILFDRPFEIGDFIVIGDFMGTVEYIGVKTTRLRSISGEQLIIANADLTDSKVRNYKRMDKRRIVFTLGVEYDTPLNKLKAMPQMLQGIIKVADNTLFDRAHFYSFGDSSLIFEVVYFVLSSDYNKYMDVQQKINFSIKELFEKEKIQFAFPTQTIHVRSSTT